MYKKIYINLTTEKEFFYLSFYQHFYKVKSGIIYLKKF